MATPPDPPSIPPSPPPVPPPVPTDPLDFLQDGGTFRIANRASRRSRRLLILLTVAGVAVIAAISAALYFSGSIGPQLPDHVQRLIAFQENGAGVTTEVVSWRFVNANLISVRTRFQVHPPSGLDEWCNNIDVFQYIDDQWQRVGTEGLSATLIADIDKERLEWGLQSESQDYVNLVRRQATEHAANAK